jgi:hypothetical protein
MLEYDPGVETYLTMASAITNSGSKRSLRSTSRKIHARASTRNLLRGWIRIDIDDRRKLPH